MAGRFQYKDLADGRATPVMNARVEYLSTLRLLAFRAIPRPTMLSQNK